MEKFSGRIVLRPLRAQFSKEFLHESFNSYCLIFVDQKKFKTETHYCTLSPIWSSIFETYINEEQIQSIKIEIWEKEVSSQDTFFGECVIPVEKFNTLQKSIQDFKFFSKSNEIVGAITLEFEWILDEQTDNIIKEKPKQLQRLRSKTFEEVNSDQFEDELYEWCFNCTIEKTLFKDYINATFLKISGENTQSMNQEQLFEAISELFRLFEHQAPSYQVVYELLDMYGLRQKQQYQIKVFQTLMFDLCGFYDDKKRIKQKAKYFVQ